MGWFIDRFRKKEGVSPEIDNEKEEIVPNSGGMRVDSPGGTALKVTHADTPSVNLKVDTGNAALKVQTSSEPVEDAKLKALITKAEKGEVATQSKLGLMYLSGLNVERSYLDAYHWLKKAAENNDREAQYFLGTMYEEGKRIGISYEQAKYWYEKSAKQKYGLAIQRLRGMKRERPELFGLPSRTESAPKKEEIEPVKAAIGLRIREGFSPEKTAYVRETLEKAEHGNTQCQTLMGLMFLEGSFVEQSYSDALDWLLKAAKKNDREAQYYIGTMYEHGKGVMGSESTARTWYERSAKQGYNLARMRLEKITGMPSESTKNSNGSEVGLRIKPGVSANNADYVMTTKQNADRGDVQSMKLLGMMYLEGTFMEQSYPDALHWLEESAIKGDREAMYYLGTMYENGKGVKASVSDARIWYEASAKKGNNLAKIRLSKLRP